MKKIINLISIMLLIFFLSIQSACTKQCETLEAKILECESLIKDCDSDNKVYGEACEDIKSAKKLIQNINNSNNKDAFEDSCTLSLNYIDFDSCKDIKSNITQDQIINRNYIMKDFGKMGELNSLDSNFIVDGNLVSQEDDSCKPLIFDSLKNKILKGLELNFKILDGYSMDHITVLESIDKYDQDSIFIGNKYISCKFNESFKYENSSRAFKDYLNSDKNDDECKNDFMFCSISSGWLDSHGSESSCYLTKEDVFLLNWKENFFIDWCTNNYKLNPHDGSKCKAGCGYECTKDSYIKCKDFYKDNSCALISNVITDCSDKLTDGDKDILNDCLGNLYNDKCKKSCIDKEEGEICDIDDCIHNGIKMDQYQENEGKVLECLSLNIFNLSEEFLDCSQEFTSKDEQKCNLQEEMDRCIEEDCIEVCTDIETCKLTSCYVSCEKKNFKLKIDIEKSSIFTFFKEEENESDSKCNKSEIFSNGKYCVIDFKISESTVDP